MKNSSAKVLTAFLALTSLVSYAQRHQPPDPAKMVQHRVDFLTEKLGLSSAQQQQATTIFTNQLNTEKSQRGQMRAVHESLQAAMQKNDTAGIEQASSTMGNLIAQSIADHTKAEAAFYQTLSPDQQTKYSGMHVGGWGGATFRRHRGFAHPGAPPQL